MPRITQINGKPVVYPTTPLTLEVTDDHVKRGRRKDWCHCAIAQSVLDIKGVIHAAVTLSRLYVEFKDRVEVRRTPSAAKMQLVGFDRFSEIVFASGDYTFAPLSPSEVAHRGSNTNRNSKLNKKKRNKRIPLVGVRSKFNPVTDLK